MIKAQFSRAYQGCAEAMASKDSADHTEARRRCEAWTQWSKTWGTRVQFEQGVSKLKGIYARGCDAHALAMECGKSVRAQGPKLDTKAVLNHPHYKAFRKLAAKECVAQDASACLAVLSLFPNRPELLDRVMRTSYKTLVIKHAHKTCASKQTQAACLPLAVVSGGSKQWGSMRALCDTHKNSGACAQLAGHTRRASASKAWSQKGCAMGHGPSCAHIASTPKQWRTACAYAQLSACQRLSAHLDATGKNDKRNP